MDFDLYQAEACRTAGELGTFIGTVERVLGIAGEAGEVADYMKKVLCHGHPLDINRLKKELGDVQWYIAVIAATYNIPLSEIANLNVQKLRARYPEGFSPVLSINRKENDT